MYCIYSGFHWHKTQLRKLFFCQAEFSKHFFTSILNFFSSTIALWSCCSLNLVEAKIMHHLLVSFCLWLHDHFLLINREIEIFLRSQVDKTWHIIMWFVGPLTTFCCSVKKVGPNTKADQLVVQIEIWAECPTTT